jgi:hypothetical protein
MTSPPDPLEEAKERTHCLPAPQSRHLGDLQSPEKSPGIPGLWRAEFSAETRSLPLFANSAPKVGLSLRSPFSNLRNS